MTERRHLRRTPKHRRLVWLAGALTLALPASANAAPAESQGSAVPATAADVSVAAVSAASTDDVWAVGEIDRYPHSRGLIEHWDGSSWTRVAVRNPGGRSVHLRSVQAVAANDAWAVGDYFYGKKWRTLVLHWDGTAWTQTSAPSPGHRGRYRGSRLEAVHAISSNDVWAVGKYYTYSSREASPLIERWDGTTWKTLDMPKPEENTWLSTILASSPKDVTVAGGYGDGFADDLMFTGHWDGKSWTITYPHTPGVDAYPAAGYAASASDQWIVGSYRAFSKDKEFIEHRNGSSWRRMRGANPPNWSGLDAVAGTSATDVWAVGLAYVPGQWTKPLIEHWDGMAWTRVPAPKLRPPIPYGASAVAAITPDDAWLVADTGTSHTTAVAAHWDGSSWTWVPMP